MKKVKKFILRVLVDNQIRNNKKKYEHKINELNKRFSKPKKDQVCLDHLKKWKVFDKRISGEWLAAYSRVNGEYSSDYVPESIYYSFLEPVLNNYEHCISYSDKNIYDLIYREGLFPNTLIRSIDSSIYDRFYNPIASFDDYLNDLKAVHKEIILKPSIDSGGGVNVMLFKLRGRDFVNTDNEMILNKDFLDARYKTNFVLQEKLKSHSDLSKFNPSSLNTIRILTYRSVATNEVVVLNCVLRVGAEGAVVDNSRAGGVAVGVDSRGKLNNFATDKKGNIKMQLNGHNLSNSHTVPKFDEILQVSKTIAQKNIHHRLLGLDMVVDEFGDVKCIEVNNKGNEINFFQFNNGPLFKEYTDEIIGYCYKNMSKLYNRYEWK